MRVMENYTWHVTKAHFTLGVKANVQLKSSIPIRAKVEISPKCFALGVKGWNRKKLFNMPQFTNKCWTLWPCIGRKPEKKGVASNLGSQFATLGANVPAFINILMSMFLHLLVTWGQTTSPKCSKLAPSFFRAQAMPLGKDDVHSLESGLQHLNTRSSLVYF